MMQRKEKDDKMQDLARKSLEISRKARKAAESARKALKQIRKEDIMIPINQKREENEP